VWNSDPDQNGFPETGEKTRLAGNSGTSRQNQLALVRELAAFEEGNGALHFTASDDCAFLVASATKLPQALSLGYYSVHSSPQTLQAGEQRIKEIGAVLKS